MIDYKQAESWRLMLTQAERFAAKKHYTDALARLEQLRHLLVQACREPAMNITERRQAQALAYTVEELRALWTAAFQADRATLASQRQQQVDAAATIMQQPLPQYD